VDGVRPDLVSPAEIQEAARLLAPVVVRTPLVPVPMLQPGLLIKPESLQPTGSFKLRGAYAAISASGVQAKERGVVAHSHLERARQARLVAEPGGAAAVAACLFHAAELPAARSRVAVLSGGNIDPAMLAAILAEG
jgi:threonine dehydratase